MWPYVLSVLCVLRVLRVLTVLRVCVRMCCVCVRVRACVRVCVCCGIWYDVCVVVPQYLVDGVDGLFGRNLQVAVRKHKLAASEVGGMCFVRLRVICVCAVWVCVRLCVCAHVLDVVVWRVCVWNVVWMGQTSVSRVPSNNATNNRNH